MKKKTYQFTNSGISCSVSQTIVWRETKLTKNASDILSKTKPKQTKRLKYVYIIYLYTCSSDISICDILTYCYLCYNKNIIYIWIEIQWIEKKTICTNNEHDNIVFLIRNTFVCQHVIWNSFMNIKTWNVVSVDIYLQTLTNRVVIILSSMYSNNEF